MKEVSVWFRTCFKPPRGMFILCNLILCSLMLLSELLTSKVCGTLLRGNIV
uniref:Macaca fascicularis brain cDNA, clone: QflA-21934 n=1 Tax=Macaca fascicularis TaxID=9541 RepID=I7GDC6_MACFA|nr:unnamed protein product [Macaca fascicularis]